MLNLIASIGIFFSSLFGGHVFGATSLFITQQGGTGTSSPSGILYGDNGATSHLNTVTIGANCTFSAGTLNCTGGSGSAFPFTPTQNYGVNTSATSTPLFAQAGLFASSTSHLDQITVGSTTAGLTSTSTFFGNIKIGNSAARTNLLQVDCNMTYPASQSVGGCGNFNNTNNLASALTIYTNGGAGQTAPLFKIRDDNTAYDQEMVTFQSISATRSTEGIEGSSTAQAVLKITHHSDGMGDDANVSDLSLDALGTNTAAQGIFIDSTAPGGSTGNKLTVRNGGNGIDELVIKANGWLGIATSTPYAPLAVVGAGGVVAGKYTATSTGSSFSDLTLPPLATVAGTFLAADAAGKIIATTTPSGGGSTSQSVSTSSAETANQIPYWTTTSATPALLSGGNSGLQYNGTTLTANFATTTYITTDTITTPTQTDNFSIASLSRTSNGSAASLSLSTGNGLGLSGNGGAFNVTAGGGTGSGIGGAINITGGGGSGGCTGIPGRCSKLTVSNITSLQVGTSSSGTLNSTFETLWNGSARSNIFGVVNSASTTVLNITDAGNVQIPPLATPAGSFLAVDPSGYIIATTTPSGGGSTSPGGSNTDVQFNNSGSFGGNDNFTYDATNNILTVNHGAVLGTSTDANLGVIDSELQLASFFPLSEVTTDFGPQPANFEAHNFDASVNAGSASSTDDTLSYQGGAALLSGGNIALQSGDEEGAGSITTGFPVWNGANWSFEDLELFGGTGGDTDSAPGQWVDIFGGNAGDDGSTLGTGGSVNIASGEGSNGGPSGSIILNSIGGLLQFTSNNGNLFNLDTSLLSTQSTGVIPDLAGATDTFCFQNLANCGSGGGSAFPFTPQSWGNSTTTALGLLTGGLLVNAASSTFTGGVGLATTTFNQAVQIGATAANHAFYVNPTGTYSTSDSVGGAANMTFNSTNAGLYLSSTNTGSTGAVLGVDCAMATSNTQCIRIESSITNQSTFNIQGTPTGLGIFKVSSTGDQGVNGSILSLDSSTGSNTGQGIFLKSNATGLPLNIVNSVSSKLFQIDALGNSTTTGLVQISSLNTGTVNSLSNGTLYSTATSTASTGSGLSYSGTMGSEIGGVSGTLSVSGLTGTNFTNAGANTVFANATGASAAPSFVATSTFFGTGVGGRVLTWNNGVPQWLATTTYSSGLTFANGNVTNTGVTSIVAGTNITVSGSTGAVTVNATGGAAFLFTPTNNFGINTNATSTTLSLFAGLNASSTSHIASTTFDVTGFVGIGTTTNAYGTSKFSTVITNAVTSLGGLLINTVTNVTNAFSIINAAGTTVFNVDTTATNPFLGIGTTTPWATLSVVGDGTDPLFAVATSSNQGLPNFEVDANGHIVSSGVKPVCTTGCTFGQGNDNDFRITVGTTISTEVVTFAKTWGTLAPICQATEGNDTASPIVIAASSTPTTVTLTNSALSAKDIDVSCRGIQ